MNVVVDCHPGCRLQPTGHARGDVSEGEAVLRDVQPASLDSVFGRSIVMCISLHDRHVFQNAYATYVKRDLWGLLPVQV